LKQLGVSEKVPFFRFQCWEVVAAFDILHLLKITHNLVLKRDVANVEFEITVTGKHLTVTTK
jgi:hypothetical protein